MAIQSETYKILSAISRLDKEQRDFIFTKVYEINQADAQKKVLLEADFRKYGMDLGPKGTDRCPVCGR